MIVVLSKLVSAFLLPPGIFILLGMGIAAYAFLSSKKVQVEGVKKQARGVAYLSLGSALILYFISIEPVAEILLYPLENPYPPFSELKKSPDTLLFPIVSQLEGIVVLGGGTVSHSPEEGSDSLRPDPLKRLLYAVRIHRVATRLGLRLPLVLVGGKVFDTGQEAEAEVMARFAREWDVPEELIFIEAGSRTTWQNAQKTAQTFPLRKILLVTSAYHMPRAMWCFTQAGFQPTPAPTDYKINRGIPYDLESFLPTGNSFENSRRALHEYLGLFLYRLFYR
ncbi:MAG: YdcF family protein [Spirochaetales bacterium]